MGTAGPQPRAPNLSGSQLKSWRLGSGSAHRDLALAVKGDKKEEERTLIKSGDRQLAGDGNMKGSAFGIKGRTLGIN